MYAIHFVYGIITRHPWFRGGDTRKTFVVFFPVRFTTYVCRTPRGRKFEGLKKTKKNHLKQTFRRKVSNPMIKTVLSITRCSRTSVYRITIKSRFFVFVFVVRKTNNIWNNQTKSVCFLFLHNRTKHPVQYTPHAPAHTYHLIIPGWRLANNKSYDSPIPLHLFHTTVTTAGAYEYRTPENWTRT